MLDDPRDPSLETKFIIPRTWRGQDNVDGLATSGMFLAGLIMVTRNRILAWPSLILGASAWINQHPLRTKEGGTPPIGNLILGFTALIAAYLPLFLKPGSATASSPLRQVPLN
ncbi:hypothetical protein B0F90DRAFT_1631424 [Multifurca ochricompacta]|uniref:Uncharacterized protein n=1 Tax=Multifurca ochricompacta TaxID=376703 RepID=A0AAD4M281_9AGAM|nr:hypothetical protein B0F90DRAFT_1631424 [Multifurca ochricompacta]